MSGGCFRRAAGLLVLAGMLGAFLSLPALAAEDERELWLFWGNGCPHCAAERQFLTELAADYPDLVVVEREVWYDAANRELMAAMLAERGLEPRAVPTTIIDERVWVGFNDAIGEEIRAAVAAALSGDTGAPPTTAPAGATVDLPFLGEIDVGDHSLLVSTLLIGFVDGFNPCSLWVMSILLALVLRTGSRRRVLAVGGTFLLITAALYALYIGGLYGALSYAANLGWIRAAMALVALAFGIVNLKDYFWFKQGFSLTIPESKKPGIYRQVRRVSEPDRPLPAVLAGTAGLAVGVSLIETPCTAGYPVLWANLLAERGVELAAASALFAAYMLVFLADELVVFGTAVVAMRAAKLEERHGRLLKLVSGVVMVVLAAVLIAAPGLMESVTGATLTFLVAALLTAAIVAVERLVRGRRPQKRPPSGRAGGGAPRRPAGVG